MSHTIEANKKKRERNERHAKRKGKKRKCEKFYANEKVATLCQPKRSEFFFLFTAYFARVTNVLRVARILSFA